MYGKARIYYADGSARDTDDLALLPKVGVIAINQIIDGGRRTRYDHDFYWINNGEWFGGDRHGADMYLMQSGYKLILFGMHINTHLFKAILHQAQSDPDFSAAKVS